MSAYPNVGAAAAAADDTSRPLWTANGSSADEGGTPSRVTDSVFDPRIPPLLPHETMYKIQVGNRLFKISGASLSSDGPSYFTKCFSRRDAHAEQVLFIDRSAEVFQLIYDHLQGYFINIENEVQYTMLYADAMYYSLPHLRALLKETEYYFTNIGGKSFKIPRKLFRRRGDSPNYFLMTSGALYADVESVFIEKKLLRPPPQAPPYVARSPEYFGDLMQLLGGSYLDLDDCRRESLIKECRYYRFLNLEQRLIKHSIAYNPYTQEEEICLKLGDVNEKGVEFPTDNDLPPCLTGNEAPTPFDEEGSSTPGNDSTSQQPPLKRLKSGGGGGVGGGGGCPESQQCWHMCNYTRPYVDECARKLCFQVDRMDCTLVFNKRTKTIHICLGSETAKCFEAVFAEKLAQMGINLGAYRLKKPALDLRAAAPKPAVQLALPACLSVCDLSINGTKCPSVRSALSDSQKDEEVPDLTDLSSKSSCPGVKVRLTKSMWKLGVRPGKVMMIAMKAEAFKGVKEFCKLLDYL